jgi:phosphoglycolate phosphatase
VLDFDGVVLESVDVKARAFLELLGEGLDERQRERIVGIHVENPGATRHDKFRMIHEELFGHYDEALAPGLEARFSAIVRREMTVCPFVPGALHFLRASARRYALFIASAAPEAELRAIVAEREIAPLFKGVYGAPRTKHEILASVLHDERLEPAQVVFVGDAPSDQAAALRAGLAFVGRRANSSAASFAPRGILATVDDLAELEARWDEIVAGAVAQTVRERSFPLLATPRALSLAIRGLALTYQVALRLRGSRGHPGDLGQSGAGDDGSYPLY